MKKEGEFCSGSESACESGGNWTAGDNVGLSNADNTGKNMLCEEHKTQKLTHIIDDTNELICVFCAFEKCRLNSSIKIKEIRERCIEINAILSNIINDTNYNSEIIENIVKEAHLNYENETKKVEQNFSQIYNILERRKESIMNELNDIYSENKKKIDAKICYFKKLLNKCQDLKENLKEFEFENDRNLLSSTLKTFNKLYLDHLRNNNYSSKM